MKTLLLTCWLPLQVAPSPAVQEQVVAAPTYLPAYVDGKLALEDAAGHWEMLGYGQILSLSEDGARAYSITSKYSWDITDALELEHEDVLFGPMLPGNQRHFVTSPDETPYLVQRLDKLPESCTTEVDWTPARLFDAFDAVFADHYPFFEVWDFDWDSRVKAARAQITPTTTDLELAQLMASCLDGLGDGHVSFEVEVDGEEVEHDGPQPLLFQRVAASIPKDTPESEMEKAFGEALGRTAESIRTGIREGILGGNGKESDPIKWGRVERDIGYIFCSGMGVEDAETLEEMVAATHAAMNEALTDLKGVRALVIDISLNGGGVDAVSHAIAGHLTDKRRLAYTKGPSARPDISHEIYIEPAAGVRQPPMSSHLKLRNWAVRPTPGG